MRLSSSILLLSFSGLIACGVATRPPVNAPAASVANTAKSPEAPSASGNIVRDRRADPGVRAAAKPLVLGKASSVQCGKLKKASSDGEASDLLSGRLSLRAPEGAKAPPPLADAPAAEEESRLVADGPKIALAIVARETFQLDPDLYEAEADTKPGSLDVEAPKFLKATFPMEGAAEVHPVAIGPSKMRAYVARPQEPNAAPGKDTALVLALLVAQEDGALETVAFYVRGEGVRSATGDDLVGCTRLAERIASTIVPGSRKLERDGGRKHVADVSKEEELTITVPADYVAIPAKSAKAAGSRILKLRPLSLFAGSINVVVTDETPKSPEGADERAAGTLLGHPVEWRGKTTPKGGFLFAAEPLEAKGKTAEVLVKATRHGKALDELRAVAETLAVVKR